MKNSARKVGLFQVVLLALAVLGCAVAVDDGNMPPADETTAADTQPLRGATNDDATLDADAADCDAAPRSAGVQAGTYEELTSILEAPEAGLAAAPAGNACTRACACCKRGNRFCCSHCRFCSGPIGIGSGGVLAP